MTNTFIDRSGTKNGCHIESLDAPVGLGEDSAGRRKSPIGTAIRPHLLCAIHLTSQYKSFGRLAADFACLNSQRY